MEISTLLLQAKEWGPTAICTIIAFVISYLIKQQNKNFQDDKEREHTQKDELKNALSRIEEHFAKSFDEINKKIEQHDKDISLLKMDFLRKEDFFKDMGGWRAELNRLSDLIINQNNSAINKIIELWKEWRLNGK